MNTDQDTFLLFDAAVREQRTQWLSLWHRWRTQEVMAHQGYGELFARPGDRIVCALVMA
jgi:hypothetical protein